MRNTVEMQKYTHEVMNCCYPLCRLKVFATAVQEQERILPELLSSSFENLTDLVCQILLHVTGFTQCA